jgi:CHAT domain-containing protein
MQYPRFHSGIRISLNRDRHARFPKIFFDPREAKLDSARRTILLLAAMAGLLVLSGGSPSAPATDLPEIEALRAAFAETGPLNARITADLQPPPGRPRDGRATPVLRGEAFAAVDRIQNRAGKDPAALHALALAYLALEEPRSALLTLEELTAREPHRAEAWSDLAAVRFALARETGSVLELLEALEATRRALELDPAHPAALHNRAEALTRLHLRFQATRAWEAYLKEEPTSPWAEAARARRRQLAEPTLKDQWEAARPRLLAAAAEGDRAAVHELTARFPDSTRALVEEKLLPGWAAVERRGDRRTADARLQALRLLAEALAEATGDLMVGDTLPRIDSEIDPVIDSALLAGLDAFGRGMALYRSQGYEPAFPDLDEASRLLHRAGAAFAGWADLYSGVGLLYSDPIESERRFRHALADAERGGHPALAGRAHWILGTLSNNSNSPEKALGRYRQAFELLDASGGPQASGFAHVLLAEAHGALGDLDSAWREHAAAFAGLGRIGDSARLQPALQVAATNLVNQGLPGPALDFLEEALEHCAILDQPGRAAEAQALRGAALEMLGRRREAAQAFTAARRDLDPMTSAAQGERLAALLAVNEAAALVRRDPGQAVQTLTAAVEGDLQRGFRFQLTRMLALRAQAREALGDWRGTEEDLRAALLEHERIRGDIEEPLFRASAFEQAQAAFDEMIRLQVERGDAAAAFAFSERARARALLDRIASAPAGRLPAPVAVSEVIPRLPEGVALVEFAVLPKRLVTWVLRKGGMEFGETEIASEDLARLVQGFRASIERGANQEEVKKAGRELSEALLAPVLPHLPADATVVFVPDRFLARVPFAALPVGDRFFVEHFAHAVAPSASLYLETVERRKRFDPNAPWTLLAIGNPAFDRKSHPRLQPLRHAEAEAREVAALYERADVLVSEAATRKATTHGPRLAVREDNFDPEADFSNIPFDFEPAPGGERIAILALNDKVIQFSGPTKNGADVNDPRLGNITPLKELCKLVNDPQHSNPFEDLKVNEIDTRAILDFGTLTAQDLVDGSWKFENHSFEMDRIAGDLVLSSAGVDKITIAVHEKDNDGNPATLTWSIPLVSQKLPTIAASLTNFPKGNVPPDRCLRHFKHLSAMSRSAVNHVPCNKVDKKDWVRSEKSTASSFCPPSGYV